MKHPSKGLESTFGIIKAQTLSNQIGLVLALIPKEGGTMLAGRYRKQNGEHGCQRQQVHRQDAALHTHPYHRQLQLRKHAGHLKKCFAHWVCLSVPAVDGDVSNDNQPQMLARMISISSQSCCVLRLSRLTSSVIIVSPSLAISRSIWSCFFVFASPCSYSKMTSSAPAVLSSFSAVDDKHFTVTAEVEISDLFFGWLLSFGGRVKILYPSDVLEDFRAYIEKMRGLYMPEEE